MRLRDLKFPKYDYDAFELRWWWARHVDEPPFAMPENDNDEVPITWCKPKWEQSLTPEQAAELEAWRARQRNQPVTVLSEEDLTLPGKIRMLYVHGSGTENRAAGDQVDQERTGDASPASRG